MSFPGFYRAFEERFYAPRSVIKRLREQYLPYVAPLLPVYPGACTMDIGCGRGEWLELMQGLGLKPFGVDLDEGMLQACRELGLPVQQGDAIEHLKTLGDETQVVVSAFHVVEHIAFEQLQTLVVEALRVLKPGGLLIMETPNPENVEVATRNFYLDPTHQRPIPPMLLGFLPEFHGFARVATLRLQEPQDIHTRTDIKLIDVLHGVSPDYAVVAQKGATAEIMQAFDSAFSTQHGVDLHNLANRFDQRQDGFLAAHHETWQGLLVQQQQSESQRAEMHALQESVNALHVEQQALRADLATQESVNALHVEQQALRADLATQESVNALHVEQQALRADLATQESVNALHVEQQALRADLATQESVNALHVEQQALRADLATQESVNALHVEQQALRADLAIQESVQALHAQLQSLHANLAASNAERDALRNSLSWKITAPLRGIGSFVASPLSYTMGKVLRNPRLSARANEVLRRFPGLHARLRSLAIARGMMMGDPAVSAPAVEANPISMADLSPKAREIHTSLVQAIERNKD